MSKNKLVLSIHRLPDGKFGIRYEWGILAGWWICKVIKTKEELLEFLIDEVTRTFPEVKA